jgi:hypothetical protein
MRLRKIPLESLINLLADLYDGGADYIDITAETTDTDEPDQMKITVKPEYISEDLDTMRNVEIDFEDDDGDEDEQEVKKPSKETRISLSEDDINDLI